MTNRRYVSASTKKAPAVAQPLCPTRHSTRYRLTRTWEGVFWERGFYYEKEGMKEKATGRGTAAACTGSRAFNIILEPRLNDHNRRTYICTSNQTQQNKRETRTKANKGTKPNPKSKPNPSPKTKPKTTTKNPKRKKYKKKHYMSQHSPHGPRIFSRWP